MTDEDTSPAYQNSLEDVIINTVKAYQNQDSETLNNLISREFGLTLIHRPGAMDDFIFSEGISFHFPEPEYRPYETGFTVDDVIKFEELPEYDCGEDKWNKPPGIYCDKINRSHELSTIAKNRNEYLEDNYSATKIKQFEALENASHKVIVLGENGTFFKFYLTLKDDKWYLTVIDRTDYCSA
jgi:hypothetical protein